MSREVVSKDIMKEALRKSMEIKLAAYEKKIEKEEDHIFSEEYRKHMDRMLQTEESKEENRTIRYRSKRKSLRLKIALVAAIIMLMGSMTVLAVEPIREKLYEMIEKIFPDHTDITFGEIEEAIGAEKRAITSDNFEIKRLENVPEQYEVEYEEAVPEVCDYMLIYTDAEENSIIYQQQAIEYIDVWSITSDGTAAEKISIHGDVGYALEDEKEWRTIIYPCDGYVYSLSGNEEVEVLVDILETIFE